MVADPGLSDTAMREQLQSVLATHRARRPATRAQLVRERLIDGVRPVRALLSALVQLSWQATDAHPVLAALRRLQGLYAYDQRRLPADVHVSLGRVWQAALASPDRERAFGAFEVATLLGLRRALHNGTVWIDHSLAFRSREQLLIPAARWHAHRRAPSEAPSAAPGQVEGGIALEDQRGLQAGPDADGCAAGSAVAYCVLSAS